jgi:hypothetical protein
MSTILLRQIRLLRQIQLLRRIQLVALYQSAPGAAELQTHLTDRHHVLVHLNRVPSCRDQIPPATPIGPTDKADRAGRHMESMT